MLNRKSYHHLKILIGTTILATSVAVFGGAPAAADWKPTKDVELVVPFGLGGGADILARTVVKIITENKFVPQPINVVNKPGGGTAVGVAYVDAKKRGDPHTLVLINPQMQLTPLRVEGAKGWRQLTPVTSLMLDDYLIMVRKDSPYQNATGLIEAAKGMDERAISIGSAGTADDMAIAVFEAGTGIKLNTVRFNSGGEILTALLGGHIDLGAGNPVEFIGQIQAGAVRALGVFRETRFTTMSDVPTLKEQGINTAAFQMWRGIAMPGDAPADAAAYWADVMQKVGNSADFADYISSNVATMHVLAPTEFNNFLETQEALYKDMLKRLGIIK
jgi:putative tricarboxylic transport membrane protein